MQPRERVLRALAHKEVDTIPHWDDFSSAEAEILFLGEKYRKSSWLEKNIFISNLLDTDIVWVPLVSYGFSFEDTQIFCETIYEGDDYALIKDPFGGLHYCRKRPYFTRTLINPIKEKSDLEKLEKVDVERFEAKIKSFSENIQKLHDMDYFILVEIKGPFAATWMFLRGLYPFLIDVIKDTDFAKRLVERSFKPIMEIVNIATKNWSIDGVRVCDDLGDQKNPFFHIEKYRTLFKPWHSKLVEMLHEKGVKVFLHSHGNVMSFFQDFIEAGFDCIDPLDPTDNMDLSKLKETYGQKVALMGGVSKNIGMMSTEEIVDHLRDRLLTGGPTGYILHCAGGIPPEMSLEKFNVYINTIKKYRNKQGRHI